MPRWLVPALVLLAACKVRDPPPITGRWTDVFERNTVGRNYFQSGPGYQVTGGALAARGADHHPLWLRKRLPHDVRIELDAWVDAPAGELRVVVFGDGKSFAAHGARDVSTGYLLSLGGAAPGARIEAQGRAVATGQAPGLVPGRHYHWKIERTGRTLRWYVGDMDHALASYVDPHPLEGAGHQYFAVEDGASGAWFDNLAITPL
jgi:hypothetical protein